MAIYIFAGLILVMVIFLLILCQHLSNTNEVLEKELEKYHTKLYNIPDNILEICRSCGGCYEKQKVADEKLIDELVNKIRELVKS